MQNEPLNYLTSLIIKSAYSETNQIVCDACLKIKTLSYLVQERATLQRTSSPSSPAASVTGPVGMKYHSDPTETALAPGYSESHFQASLDCKEKMDMSLFSITFTVKYHTFDFFFYNIWAIIG